MHVKLAILLRDVRRLGRVREIWLWTQLWPRRVWRRMVQPLLVHDGDVLVSGNLEEEGGGSRGGRGVVRTQDD